MRELISLPKPATAPVTMPAPTRRPSRWPALRRHPRRRFSEMINVISSTFVRGSRGATSARLSTREVSLVRPRSPSDCARDDAAELSLRELEALARARLAGLLPFLHPRIAGKQSLGLQRAAQICVHLQEGARDPEARRPGLTGRAAARGVNRDVVGVGRASPPASVAALCFAAAGREIILEALAVDVDFAVARRHANARDRRLAAPSGDEFLCLSHENYFVSPTRPFAVVAPRGDARRRSRP